MKVKVRSKYKLPKYATDGSSGMDVYAAEDVCIWKGNRALVKTGLFVEIPKGYEIQVRPRSGLALKEGITVLNTPGTIDADYRGEIGVILFNTGHLDYLVHAGDRIAQIVLAPVERIEWEQVDTLDETERGDGGYGSTG